MPRRPRPGLAPGGSKVSRPSGRILDTGQVLKTELVTGAQMKASGTSAGDEPVAPDQEVVIVRFPPVKKGQSLRLRLSETNTAPQSYRLDGDELVFDRSLGRPRNSVILPGAPRQRVFLPGSEV